MCSDLQYPPELIAKLISRWKNNFQVVIAVKSGSKESLTMYLKRKFYCSILYKMADSGQIIKNFIGFVLYDKKFMDIFWLYHDPYPYFRGLVSKIGFKRAEIEFVQDRRKHGQAKNNFFTLYDIAMTGFVNHSKLPLRLAVFCSFCLAVMSLIITFGYMIYKLMFWDTFNLWVAPLVIGLFFFLAVQLIFIGIIGEYICAIYTQVKNKLLVIEDERINFND